MRRDLENRLFRAEATGNATSWADLQSARHRSLLRARVKICDAISESLDVTGVEPELSVWREKAAAELANIPDTPELRAADEAVLSRAHSEKDDGGALERIKKRLDRMADGGERITRDAFDRRGQRGPRGVIVISATDARL